MDRRVRRSKRTSEVAAPLDERGERSQRRDSVCQLTQDGRLLS